MSNFLKNIVKEAVRYALNDHLIHHIEDEYRASGLPRPKVELHEISDSETQVRVVDDQGAPQYFLVKVSAQL